MPVTFEIRDGRDTGAELTALIGDLLCDAFGHELARGRGYCLLQPEFRVLAWDGDTLVGTEMGCRPACEPALRLYGIGDAAVREGWRGRGIARELGGRMLEELIRRGADLIAFATAALAKVAIDRGYEPMAAYDVELEDRGPESRFPTHWYIRWLCEPVPLVIRQRF